jgi:hypothetical protein
VEIGLTMPRGTTSEEVEQLLNMRHQTASARRTDLRAAGYTDYLYDEHGNRIRRPTTTGSSAYVEIATQKGMVAIDFHMPLQLNGGDPTISHHGGVATSTAAFGRTSRLDGARRVLECMRRFS